MELLNRMGMMLFGWVVAILVGVFLPVLLILGYEVEIRIGVKGDEDDE